MLVFLRISKKIKEETHAREQAVNKPVMQAVSNMEFYREEIKKQLFWEKTVKAVILKMYKQKILPLLKARI